ncbi:MAG: hypothetical protein Q8M31_21570 [Beijerinckiaceae bacterium]|nr:hypothetical protein [Beijerinckiaceae bacterium]
MAARLRVEFVSLGMGQIENGVASNIIFDLYSAATINVTTSATEAQSRPVVPAFGGKSHGYAILRALDNPVVVAWGANPTAVSTPNGTPNDGKRLQADEEVAVYLRSGWLISAIEVS